MKKHLTTILFFGAIWGLLEATLGYALHFAPVLISGSIMFPVASLILFRTYQSTSSKKSLMGVAVVASLIKSVNLFMPNLSPWKVINPMIMILVEACLIVVVLGALSSEKMLPNLLAMPFASVTWRVLFLAALATETGLGWMAIPSPWIANMDSMVTFAVYFGLMSGMIATLVYFANHFWFQKVKIYFAKNPIAAFSTFTLAIVATVLVNFL